jgi:ferrous iron transport protein B
VPVVPVCALKNKGLDQLRECMDRVLADPDCARPGSRWPLEGEALSDAVAVGKEVPESWSHGNPKRRRAIAQWALLSIDEEDELRGIPPALRQIVTERRNASIAAGRDLDTELVSQRYTWIDQHAADFLVSEGTPKRSWTQSIDSVLLNPLYGFPIFLTVMGALFQTLFTGADPLIGMVEQLFGWLSDQIMSLLPASILRDFITEGLIAGVGSVVVFLPQILLLFLFISVMEATGYMARVAFLMDRLMKMLGLHGRAFVPMLSGFACAIPAIMATRTMERKRDRMLTMMVVPLMTCSARLPVYTLIIATLFPPSRVFGMPVQALLMVGMYLFSTITALLVAAVLSRTIFKGPTVPLILELPPYRMPDARRVIQEMWSKGKVFLTEAGTVILGCTVALWLLLSFPRSAELSLSYEAQRAQVQAEASLDDAGRASQLESLNREEDTAHLRASYGGRLGRAIEPLIEPLGFDWKIGIGLIGSFAAREVFVSTMGLVYGVSADVDETSMPLRERMRAESRPDGKAVYTPLAGFSLLVFFALACQCMATVAVVKRETATWRWPLFLLGYMTALAWICSFVVYQGGLLLGIGT